MRNESYLARAPEIHVCGVEKLPHLGYQAWARPDWRGPQRFNLADAVDDMHEETERRVEPCCHELRLKHNV